MPRQSPKPSRRKQHSESARHIIARALQNRAHVDVFVTVSPQKSEAYCAGREVQQREACHGFEDRKRGIPDATDDLA